ncbi:stressosome-associated protein Prli42 [Neobacillus sp. OS1-33]|nr:stressosome-associated protein Prli42 [Neobacillus sp. OS1-33]WML25684.1 stressosome-associated protein Prli42 [Neobacillus sp. OS1-33]
MLREVPIMKSKKTRKIIVMLMLFAMLASTLLIGIGAFL